MYLKKLGINGFKSFASPVQLDFTPGVSAIVGPNGSGKSNITDAIRFVLGEQSTKSMRSHRMDDIIFSGTDKARQKGACEVTLVLSGEDGEADRIISRKLFRSGDSQYRINGKSVRLRDIQDSFRDTGLGKNGYSMVSQGGIENIVNAGPAELRAIVEEAAGIAGYKSRKAETEKKLAATRDNIERLRDILGEIEKQLKPLKGQAEKARIYFDLYEQLRTVDLLLFAQEQSIGEKEAAELEEKLKQARFSMLDAQKHAEEQDRKYLKIKQEIGTFKDGSTADEEQASVLTGRVSELEQERVRCTADSEHAQADSRRLEAEIRETESAAEQAAENLKAIEEGCRVSVRHRTELEKTGAELEEELLRYESELEELLSLQEERVSGRRSGRARKDRLTQHLVELKTQETALRVQLQTAESGLAAARAQLTDADQREQEIRSVYSRTQTALEQARKQAETVSAKAVPLREEASTVYESYQECRAAVKLTESKIDYEENLRQSYSPYNQAVKFVMKQAAERGVQGVYGPVARLIHIPARYERAIQTALGGKVQNIVVDRERTAGKMIDALKQARAGRAAFLPVDVLKIRKLSEQDHRRLQGQEGFEGIAADLVQTEERFRPAVDNLLARTLVVTDFEAGRRLRRLMPGLTVVTLDGEIFYPGGAVVGGSQASSRQSVFFNESKLNEFKGRLEEQKKKARELAVRYKSLQKEIASAADDSETTQQMLGDLQKQAWEAGNNLELFENERTEAGQKQKQLSETIRDTGAELTVKQQSIVKLNEEIEQLSKAIQPTDAESLADQENLIREKIRCTQESSTSQKVELARVNQEIASFEQRKTVQEQRAAEINEKAGSLQTQLKQARQLGEAAVRGAKQAGEACEQLRGELKQLRDKIAESDRQVAALEQKKEAAEEAVKQFNRSYMLETEEKNKVEQELDRVRLRAQNREERIYEQYEMNYAMVMREAAALGEKNQEITRENQRSLSARIRGLGNINASAIEEYDELNARHTEMKLRMDDLIEAEQEILEVIDELSNSMRERFGERFGLLQTAFSEVFTRLFEGGTARLSYTDPEDILTSGIELTAQPPGKNLRHISLLSGGEKAMTAISLLLAFIRINPAPFVIIDEIDAALDDSNIIRFTNYIDEIRDENQFIMITHRKTTLRICERIYGVSMNRDGISRLVSVEVSDYTDENSPDGEDGTSMAAANPADDFSNGQTVNRMDNKQEDQEQAGQAG